MRFLKTHITYYTLISIFEEVGKMNKKGKKVVWGLLIAALLMVPLSGVETTIVRELTSVEEHNTITTAHLNGGWLEERNGVKIESEKDARLVWDAFCDLHQKRWKNQGIKKIDSSTWHLGVITIDDFHYYYRVVLNADGIVQNAKLHAEEIK